MRTSIPASFALCLILASSGCTRRVVVPTPGMNEQVREEPPPGMMEVNVVSEYGDQVWDLHTGGSMVCSTPCTQWLGIGQGVVLKARDGDMLYVDDLGLEAIEARRALLVAEGTCHGKNINGIVFTTFGGMGVVIGTTFTAIGCSDLQERAGMCSAGLITGGVSALVTTAALLMLIDSLPKAHVIPVHKAPAAAGKPAVSLSLTPNGIAGTF